MNYPLPPRRARPSPRVPALPLSEAERSELRRQGAKAAARGEAHDANPLSQSRNQPHATGESAQLWRQRSEAWKQGHEAQSRSRTARTKRPAAGRR
ncbi:CrpP-related protein [Roseateles sp. DC23W]|uniref:CrpP-related protein n=1 Tax=Pelomonas dachongensis TaxID=3299029 RepID=A0ABW7ELR9_9BURK